MGVADKMWDAITKVIKMNGQGGTNGSNDDHPAAEDREPDGAGYPPRNGTGDWFSAQQQRQAIPPNRAKDLTERWT